MFTSDNSTIKPEIRKSPTGFLTNTKLDQAKSLFVIQKLGKAVEESRYSLLQNIFSLSNEQTHLHFSKTLLNFEQRLLRLIPEKAEQELANTYNLLNETILNSKTNFCLPVQTRLLATNHFLIHAADPESICQGTKLGAEFVCLMYKLIQQSPSKLAKLITSVCTNLSWNTFDNSTISCSLSSLIPGPEELDFKPGKNYRSYAIKLIQIFMSNNCLLRRTPPQEYIESTGRPGKYYNGQLIKSLDGEELSLEHYKLSLAELSALAIYEYELKSLLIINETSFSNVFIDTDTNMNLLIQKMSNIDNFYALLLRTKQNKELPLIMPIDERRLLASNYQDGINHYIAICDINENGLVKIFNPQFLPGTQRTSWLNLKRLFEASVTSFGI